jgi:hypothetical protein
MNFCFFIYIIFRIKDKENERERERKFFGEKNDGFFLLFLYLKYY